MSILKKVVLVGIIGAITVISINAKDGCGFGERGEMMRDFREGFSIKGLFRKLDLSNEQRDAIRANRIDMMEHMRSQRNNSESKKSIDFISIDGVDKEKMINSTIAKVKATATIKADFLDKNFKVLTKEQKEEFVQLLNN